MEPVDLEVIIVCLNAQLKRKRFCCSSYWLVLCGKAGGGYGLVFFMLFLLLLFLFVVFIVVVAAVFLFVIQFLLVLSSR